MRYFTVKCECGTSRQVFSDAEPATESVYGPIRECDECNAKDRQECLRRCQACGDRKCRQCFSLADGTWCNACVVAIDHDRGAEADSDATLGTRR